MKRLWKIANYLVLFAPYLGTKPVDQEINQLNLDGSYRLRYKPV